MQKTSCSLCGRNCGLEVEVEGNRIVKVKPDKENTKSEGYICRKGLNIAYQQHNADRVNYPLKKVGDSFERISWETAIAEISKKLKATLDKHGPRALAWMVSGQGCHFGIGFLSLLCRSLGSRYLYSAGGQEHTGRYWAHGLTMGSQELVFSHDIENTEMLVALGWNPLMSHGIEQAGKKVRAIAKNPDQLLVAIDPRVSETAKIADIHLPLRVGTDALLLRAMIAIILTEGMHDKKYVEEHVADLDEILPWFSGFDIKGALRVCEVACDQVHSLCKELTTRKWCMRDDLGILMNRHSSLVSYLMVVLLAVCGRICTPGGNYFRGLIAGKFHPTPEPDDPNIWRTLVSDIPEIHSMFPPNVMPEEIMNDHPDRVRAVFTYGSNPLRSYADTTAYEEAFGKLDLLVSTEMVMSETARLAHYILPSKSAFESWDSTFFFSTFPDVFFQMRRPIVEAEGEQKEGGEAFTLLADAMGLIPEIPEPLYAAGRTGDIDTYHTALTDFLASNPECKEKLPFVLAKTLGTGMGSAHLASLYGMLREREQALVREAERAGFAPGPNQGLEMYKAVIDHPEGVVLGKRDPETSIESLLTRDGKFHLYSAEAAEWITEIEPEREEKLLERDERYPFILMAGRHMDMNANTNMRDPKWNEGRRPCTLAMNPADAEKLDISDGEMVKVITDAGEESIELEITDSARRGQVIIPHGFGLIYDGVKFGVNVNRLTKNTHRDRVAATPLHRYVPCRVEVE